MTYCVGMRVDRGIVFASDSRTNAGVDSVATYSKMRFFGVPGERQFVVCSAGNLATTQVVYAQIERDMRDLATESLLTVANLSQAAEYIGRLSKAEQDKRGGGPVFESSFLIGGEVAGAQPRCYLVYPQGNYIESSHQTPYLQIGEFSYGKPILDRVVEMHMNLNAAALCSLVSMDATMRSNLTVGPPIELYVYESGGLQPGRYRKFEEDDSYLLDLRKRWNAEVRDAFQRMPEISL